MRKMKSIYLGAITVFTALISMVATAQNPQAAATTPASIELLKARSLWFNTQNSAGLTLDEMSNFNDLLFGYHLASGDFKRKSDGKDERNLSVSTQGGLNLGGGFVWGMFSYDNIKQKGTLFNTTMLEPQRGMPFYTVDANLSDWVRQDYSLSMKASTKPLMDKLFLGIEAQYNTKTGAKQVDPRSTTDFYTLNVKPGLVLKVNNHSAGLNLLYERLNQESSTTNSNNQANQDVYVLKGLGNFYEAVVGGLQSLGKFVYDGNKVGGALQYGYSGESIRLLLNGKYDFGVEDVTSSPTKPKKEGSIKTGKYEASAQLLFSGENLSKAEITWSNAQTDGIEYVQVLDNTFEVQRWITSYKSIRSTYGINSLNLKYDFFKGIDAGYKWKAGLSANYNKSEDEYYIPASEMNLEDLTLGVNAKINLDLKKSAMITAGADVCYKTNLSGNYVYGGADPESLVISDFMTPDFQYLQSDFIKIGGELSCFRGIGKSGHSGMFVKAAADWFKPKDGDHNRMLTNFSIGFTF